ncbi:MAG: DUF975 family protein [Lentisphaerae bacterium]|nr:DUF975 family protein [Lentisphaerota bacterium]
MDVNAETQVAVNSVPENGNPDCTISFSILWKAASASLKGHWGSSILACLVAMIITMAVNQIPFAVLVSGIFLFPLTVGVMLFFLRLVRSENPRVESVFEPFRQYWRMIWGYLRVFIFILLHFLLLIIPGYVALLRYSMTYYVMLDHPACTVKEAMIMSRELMYGHKWQMFGYMLLLWLIAIPVAVFTLGIGILWYAPFIHTFTAVYYEKLRQQYELKQSAVQSE